MKPAPVEALEAAPAAPPPLEAAVPVAGAAGAPDATERRLRRSYIKLILVGIILSAVLIGLVWVAEWLRGQAAPP